MLSGPKKYIGCFDLLSHSEEVMIFWAKRSWSILPWASWASTKFTDPRVIPFLRQEERTDFDTETGRVTTCCWVDGRVSHESGVMVLGNECPPYGYIH